MLRHAYRTDKVAPEILPRARAVDPLAQGQIATVVPWAGSEHSGQAVVEISEEEMAEIFRDIANGHNFVKVFQSIARDPEYEMAEQENLVARPVPEGVAGTLDGGSRRRRRRVAPQPLELEPGQMPMARNLGPTHGEVAPYDDLTNIPQAEWRAMFEHELAKVGPFASAVETRPASEY